MRPKKERFVETPPIAAIFKPAGIPMRSLEKVILNVDEFEAVRLSDYEQLDQEEASKHMGISRPTFTRLIEQARKKIADAIINCKELIIEGGNVHFRKNLFRCDECGHIVEISINLGEITKCPECGSLKIKNMAQHFGHGRCCMHRFNKI